MTKARFVSFSASALRTSGSVRDRGLEQARHGAAVGALGQRHRRPLAVGAEDRAGLAEQLGEVAGQVLQRAPFEHQVGELLVDRGRPPQRAELAARRLQLGAAARAARGSGSTATRGEVGEGAASSTSSSLNLCWRSTSSDQDQADDLVVEDHRHLHHRADLPVADRRLAPSAGPGGRWRRPPAAASPASRG